MTNIFACLSKHSKKENVKANQKVEISIPRFAQACEEEIDTRLFVTEDAPTLTFGLLTKNTFA